MLVERTHFLTYEGLVFGVISSYAVCPGDGLSLGAVVDEGELVAVVIVHCLALFGIETRRAQLKRQWWQTQQIQDRWHDVNLLKYNAFARF